MQINIQDVSFAFENKQIFSHFNLNIRQGERVWLSAPSGFGKTTLLRLICGLEKPQNGEINIAENGKIAAVFQEDRLLPWLSAAKNIELVLKQYPKNIRRQKAETALKAVGLEGEENRLPFELSGGMARRVALARALAADWDILLLDEPFVGIDTAVKEQIADFINRNFSGKTIIIVTHDAEEAELIGAEKIDLGERPA